MNILSDKQTKFRVGRVDMAKKGKHLKINWIAFHSRTKQRYKDQLRWSKSTYEATQLQM